MNLLRDIAHELAGLFVDDGMLALAILAIVALAAIVASFVPGSTTGFVLVAGLLFALFANVMAVDPEDGD